MYNHSDGDSVTLLIRYSSLSSHTSLHLGPRQYLLKDNSVLNNWVSQVFTLLVTPPTNTSMTLLSPCIIIQVYFIPLSWKFIRLLYKVYVVLFYALHIEMDWLNELHGSTYICKRINPLASKIVHKRLVRPPNEYVFKNVLFFVVGIFMLYSFLTLFQSSDYYRPDVTVVDDWV